MNKNLLRLIQMALLCALAYVFICLVRFPIFPSVPYLVYDPGDIPILIGAFMFGPIPGLIMTVIVSALQAIFFSGDGWVGFLMHVIATGALVMVAGSIYRARHNRKFALVSLICGTFAMGIAMIPANLFITTNAYGIPFEAVVASLPLTIAFNLIKAGVNAAVVFIIYKPLSRLFKNTEIKALNEKKLSRDKA